MKALSGTFFVKAVCCAGRQPSSGPTHLWQVHSPSYSLSRWHVLNSMDCVLHGYGNYVCSKSCLFLLNMVLLCSPWWFSTFNPPPSVLCPVPHHQITGVCHLACRYKQISWTYSYVSWATPQPRVTPVTFYFWVLHFESHICPPVCSN